MEISLLVLLLLSAVVSLEDGCRLIFAVVDCCSYINQCFGSLASCCVIDCCRCCRFFVSGYFLLLLIVAARCGDGD